MKAIIFYTIVRLLQYERTEKTRSKQTRSKKEKSQKNNSQKNNTSKIIYQNNTKKMNNI